MMNLTRPSLSIILFLFFILPINSTSALTKYNVLNFGAKPNGKTDTTKAFLMAWKAACASADSTIIYVPKGRYLLGSMAFQGGCKSPQIIFRIDGTLVAPQDYRVLGKSTDWLSFEGVNGVSILGGALDAKGPSLWACKASHSNCPSGATTLSFTNSKNIRIRSLLSLNSQMFHVVINGCENVDVQGVRIIAAGNSPNTDGIHVQLSKNVNIIKCSIKTGDDCISIGPGTKNLWIEQVTCGPGHGISIGSLAKDLKEEGVQNVTVRNTIFLGTQNGLRIKSWARPSTGFVQGVRFTDSLMRNVQNPIVIDQNYCPHNLNCPNQVYVQFIRGYLVGGSKIGMNIGLSGGNCRRQLMVVFTFVYCGTNLGSEQVRDTVSVLVAMVLLSGKSASHQYLRRNLHLGFVAVMLRRKAYWRLLSGLGSSPQVIAPIPMASMSNYPRTIIKCSIKTGDDCISIGPGTKNLWVEQVTCSPGHGISIGSLAKDLKEEGVQNITVKKTIFLGTQNGLRIKSWARPSNGFVQGIRFMDSLMVFGIKIKDIIYEGIRGTSSTQVAIKFDCSPKNPCTGIRLQNINLSYLNKPAQSSCSNVRGKALNLVQPESCL
ncbi:hypothetical protein GOBAR_AA18234 [Gossypium barbadense]|uniref:Pectate lyase superfamily protein domain-containing protein n=1 Tax=Gossypium barbadense TaxID=3634 RepID=A0A2P5XGH5_GOSBA|nr:hypothetical protein GOBAR_AA18234 [Gossypium barbadense]